MTRTPGIPIHARHKRRLSWPRRTQAQQQFPRNESRDHDSQCHYPIRNINTRMRITVYYSRPGTRPLAAESTYAIHVSFLGYTVHKPCCCASTMGTVTLAVGTITLYRDGKEISGDNRQNHHSVSKKVHSLLWKADYVHSDILKCVIVFVRELLTEETVRFCVCLGTYRNIFLSCSISKPVLAVLMWLAVSENNNIFYLLYKLEILHST